MMEQGMRLQGRRNTCDEESDEGSPHPIRGHSLISPKPLLNPVSESKERKELHKELLWNQRIGREVLNTKTELQRALQERRLQQNKIKIQGEETQLPEFMQVHKRITSGSQSDE